MIRKLPERRALSTAALLVAPTGDEGRMLELGREPTIQFDQDLARGLRPDGVAAPDGSDLSASPSASAPLLVSPNVIASPVSPALVQPLSPGRYKVQFTASADFREKLERLRALMGSRVPDGDLAAVIEQAVTEKLERLEARHFARTQAPDKAPAETATRLNILPSSRHIPAAVRRAVRERDGDRCRYVNEQGRRCPERNRLELHHRHPFGLGGDHSVPNISLVCRGHNAYLAACDYGEHARASDRRPRKAMLPADGRLG